MGEATPGKNQTSLLLGLKRHKNRLSAQFLEIPVANVPFSVTGLLPRAKGRGKKILVNG
jgi:hypothetical protein